MSESFFGNTKLEDRIYKIPGNLIPFVSSLELSASEVFTGCNNSTENKSCSSGDSRISVTTVSSDPENDILTFEYVVSGGKVVGKGSKVIWDLSELKPGAYTITAGVDDGCGVCGPTVTKTVQSRM